MYELTVMVCSEEECAATFLMDTSITDEAYCPYCGSDSVDYQSKSYPIFEYHIEKEKIEKINEMPF